MKPSRTVKRQTMLPYRGRPIVLIVPPECDYIGLRQKGRAKHHFTEAIT